MATTLSFSSSVGAIDLCQELIFLLARPVCWFPKLKWLSSSVAFVIVYLQPDPLAFPPRTLVPRSFSGISAVVGSPKVACALSFLKLYTCSRAAISLEDPKKRLGTSELGVPRHFFEAPRKGIHNCSNGPGRHKSCSKVRHKKHPICDAPLLRSARRNPPSVTEIAPPQPSLCVNRGPIRYNFDGRAKAIQNNRLTMKIDKTKILAKQFKKHNL